MKKFLLIGTLLVSTNVFAAGTLECETDDGSAITATVNGEAGSVPSDVKYRVREGEFMPGDVLQYITNKAFYNGSAQEEKLEKIAVRDSSTGQLVMVVSDGTLIDSTGVYSARCSFGY